MHRREGAARPSLASTSPRTSSPHVPHVVNATARQRVGAEVRFGIRMFGYTRMIVERLWRVIDQFSDARKGWGHRHGYRGTPPGPRGGRTTVPNGEVGRCFFRVA